MMGIWASPAVCHYWRSIPIIPYAANLETLRLLLYARVCLLNKPWREAVAACVAIHLGSDGRRPDGFETVVCGIKPATFLPVSAVTTAPPHAPFAPNVAFCRVEATA